LGVLPALFGVAMLACSEAAQERQALAQAAAAPALLVSDLPTSDLAGRAPGVRIVYVPAYSRIFLGHERAVELGVSLSIRNTDDRHPIELTSIRYYDSRGDLVEDYLDGVSVELATMATATQPVAMIDRRGGEGANFIVEWTSKVPASDPIVEAVMISSGLEGISFVSRGSEVQRP
jgi:hypothetical protein